MTKIAALPDDWEEAGLTPDEWAGIQTQLEAARTVKADFSKAVAAASVVYKNKVRQLERERDAKLEAIQGPFAKAVAGGMDQLTTEARIYIENGPPETRDARAKAKLAEARKLWLTRARAGADDIFRA